MGWLTVDQETFIKHVEDNKLKSKQKHPWTVIHFILMKQVIPSWL